jgi:prephenate dehydrogenase
MLVMDVGSTKRDVVDAARRVLRERIGSFVPATRSPARKSRASSMPTPALYSGRQVILTPLPQTTRTGAEGHRRVERHRRAGAEDDAREPRRGLRRRQPPAAPAGLCLLQRGGQPAAGRDYLSLAGPGFRDFTRIAASTPRPGATSWWPTAKRCSSSRSASARRWMRWSTSCAKATPTRWKA